MELIYLYQFNIKTQEFKTMECQLVSKKPFNNYCYRLSIIKNNKPHHVNRYLKESGQPDVERTNNFIIGYYDEPDKMDDFKKECVKHLLEYKEKCQNNINSLLETINMCDAAIKIIK